MEDHLSVCQCYHRVVPAAISEDHSAAKMSKDPGVSSHPEDRPVEMGQSLLSRGAGVSFLFEFPYHPVLNHLAVGISIDQSFRPNTYLDQEVALWVYYATLVALKY